MMFFQNFRMALIAIGRNKLRSVLTMLGMIIGIAAVVTVLSVGEGLNAQVKKQVNSLGVESITIGSQDSKKPLRISDFEIVKKNSNIQAAAPVTSIGASINFNKKKSEQILNATTSDLNAVLPYKVGAGRFFNDKEKDVIVLGADVAKNLFANESPLDKKVLLRQEGVNPETLEPVIIQKPFTVIGVYDKLADESSNSLGPTVLLDSTAYIPFESGKAFTKNALLVDEIDARVKNADNLAEVKASLTEALKKNRNNTDDFYIQTSEDVSESFGEVLGIVTSFVTAIAAISLLVGGIGIMNIMLTSVTERTREIGIRKSIGASRTVILLQFLTEALVLTLMGGLLGVVAAYGLGFLVELFANVRPIFTISSFAIAMGVSMFIGLLFGTFPAAQAARKKPIDALRHE